MRVLNAMLGRKRGGIEQAAVDYSAALVQQGHDVTTVITGDAAITSMLSDLGLKTQELFFPRPWNPFANSAFKKIMGSCDVAILHGNRAGKMSHVVNGMPGRPRIIAVAHSRFFDIEPQFDAVIALSEKKAAEWRQQTSCPVHVLSNMIRLPDVKPHDSFQAPPVIGAMGRFSLEKGMDIFLDALAILKNRGIRFRAVIGGGGDEEKALRQKVAEQGLENIVKFAGWITNKNAFFSSIDVFCLPSRTETFSITLLEAMSYGLPCVATDCGGPAQILQQGKTGFISGISADSLAKSLAQAFSNPVETLKMGSSARSFAAENYEFSVVAKKLDGILNLVCSKRAGAA